MTDLRAVGNGDEVEISDTQRYKLIGNAVTTNVIEFLANRFKGVVPNE